MTHITPGMSHNNKSQEWWDGYRQAMVDLEFDNRAAQEANKAQLTFASQERQLRSILQKRIDIAIYHLSGNAELDAILEEDRKSNGEQE